MYKQCGPSMLDPKVMHTFFSDEDNHHHHQPSLRRDDYHSTMRLAPLVWDTREVNYFLGEKGGKKREKKGGSKQQWEDHSTLGYI